MSSSSQSQKKHVAVLPFPFTCHPGLHAKLVLRLAATTPEVHFSFISTAKANSIIFPSHSKHDLPTNVRVYDIDDVGSSGTLLKEVELLVSSSPCCFELAIEAAVAESGMQVSCLFTDVMTPSAGEIVAKMGVKWIALYVAAPYTLLADIYINAFVNEYPQEGGAEMMKKNIDFVPGLSMFQAQDLPYHKAILNGKAYLNAVSRLSFEFDNVLPNAAAVVLNFFEEQHVTKGTTVLRSKLQNLLNISYIQQPLQPSDDPDQSGCLTWLDQQRPMSVVYVSFGTSDMMPLDEISSIAEALEETKTSYLWSLKDDLKAQLPLGFIERTSAYGKLVQWAPQTLVLSHPSVGAYLTHVGYNSMMESIAGGVPMICRPLWADNMMNARMVEDVWRIGVGVEGRVITTTELVKCLRIVMGDGEQVKRMREKIRVLKEVMIEANAPNGSSAKDFNSLVELISK